MFGKRYYFIGKLSFVIDNLFGNVFQTSALLYAKLRYYKYLNSWKKYFLVRQFIENQVFIISALFPCI